MKHAPRAAGTWFPLCLAGGILANCAFAQQSGTAGDRYVVFGIPLESPNHASPPPPGDGRTAEIDPASAASPFGWHDTDGAPGAESTRTNGNNVHAGTDTNADNVLDPGSDPDCTASLDCDFPLDLTLTPATYRPAAVTNLFYWTNLVHDVAFAYGFDPAAGNFQTNVYGGGGLGADPVQAEAQDGSGSNGANFTTPPDGLSPRLQMFVWSPATPDRDGALDNGIVVHELGHGISNRLVGGPANTSCLGNRQQPGEGLSDWWALLFTQPNDTAAAARLRGLGTYLFDQPVDGLGIRTDYYDGDPELNPEPRENSWTYASISTAAIPHGVGSRWAQAYWQVTWALIDAHGYDPDLGHFTGGVADAGNLRAMWFIVEGLKNTLCSPTFTDVRDGVLAAAVAAYGGEDVCLVWRAFAEFGLGSEAVSGGPSSTTPIDGFAVPAACSPPLFADGFETGATGRWSLTLP